MGPVTLATSRRADEPEGLTRGSLPPRSAAAVLCFGSEAFAPSCDPATPLYCSSGDFCCATNGNGTCCPNISCGCCLGDAYSCDANGCCVTGSGSGSGPTSGPSSGSGPSTGSGAVCNTSDSGDGCPITACSDGGNCWYEVDGVVIDCGGCYDIDCCAEQAAEEHEECTSSGGCSATSRGSGLAGFGIVAAALALAMIGAASKRIGA